MPESKYYDDYPESVSSFTKKLLEGLDEEKFFEIEGADYDVTFRRFAELSLKKWVKGNEMEDFSEEEFSEVLKFSIAESELNSMTEKGLLGSMEDEHGETHYFLTERGKIEMGKLENITRSL
jgi:hypothetical protein